MSIPVSGNTTYAGRRKAIPGKLIAWIKTFYSKFSVQINFDI
jgi:hypothetical protein